MEFPQQFPYLIIPTGAGPGQQRITINYGQDGKIKVYDSSGNLVDALGGPQGQYILYDSSGNMVVSLASTAGIDDKTGLPFQAGITTYTSTTAINLFGNDGTWTAADGSKVVVEAGNGASLFILPQTSAQGPWFEGMVTTMIAGGGHPAMEIDSPSDQVNGLTASLTLEGSSKTSTQTSILGAADVFNMNANSSFGNVAVGGVVITPSAANTPTKATVTFPALVGTSQHGFATAQSAVPGSQVTGVGITNITNTSADVYLTRTNTTSTGVYWMVWFT